MDLTDRSNFKIYADMLAEEPVKVLLLVNASGFGKFDATMDIDLDTNLNMVDLNVQALLAEPAEAAVNPHIFIKP